MTDARTARLDLSAALYWSLRCVGFLSSTLLISWGLFVLFFVAIGGLSFDGLMHQLNNFASRYVAADAGRVASFRQIFAMVHLTVSAGVVVVRRHRILPARAAEGSPHHV